MQVQQFNCVLLVDDDGVTNFINHRLIKKMGITSSIQSAINGNEALKFLHDFASKHDNNGPELILLDLNMPVLDGFEFLDHFEKLTLNNKNEIRIVILTTSTHQKDLTKIEKDNRNLDYFNKPLTEEKLKELLSRNQTTGAAGAGNA